MESEAIARCPKLKSSLVLPVNFPGGRQQVKLNRYSTAGNKKYLNIDLFISKSSRKVSDHAEKHVYKTGEP